jgi:hypothetical protein
MHRSLLLLLLPLVTLANPVLVEAESFADPGGWKLDTQSIEVMGSPYLLAHGLGRPVADASTTVTFPEAGDYAVYVRTKDWVARWQAPGQPGRFQVLVDGKPLATTFGTKGADWFWEPGGSVTVGKSATIALQDLTGFNGRCDAICFVKDGAAPPNDESLAQWRRERLGLTTSPIEKGPYDLVVVGGGYAGMGAAISAARMGCKVALIQNRPVLGGNGSSEVRVWAKGNIRRGKFPRIGEIIEEISDQARKSPGSYEEFEDAKKESIVRAEPNIDLFLNHHADRVETAGNRIVAVHAFDTRSSVRSRFTGVLFADCTGHGSVGHLAGAEWEMTPKGRMGMSNMWAWAEAETPVPFPKTPWALDLGMADFPYPRDHHGQWFWESGFDKDPLGDAEGIRDWNLRAVFGAFNAMKNRDGSEQHRNAYLTWVAYIGGPRESRRFFGDLVLTQDDIVAKRDFKDGCVPSTWSIDLHYPKEQYAGKFPDNPFISIAKHDRRVDRRYGYPVPYRCFYSRNIENLFLAGRNVSVTHEALGTVRVMKTCGMMGEVVGRAASICVKHDCLPRAVYHEHWDEMETLLKLPGKAYRKTVSHKIVIPDDALEEAGPYGAPSGLNPKALPGIVIDDADSKRSGDWREGSGLKGYVAWGYRYSGDKSATAEFATTMTESGRFTLRYAWQPHPNRTKRAKIVITTRSVSKTLNVDMSEPPSAQDTFHTLGVFELEKGETCSVRISATDAGGNLHIDALQFLKVN